VLAGHLWVEALPDLAQNLELMRDVRARIADGLPTLALGGGMLLLLRELADDRGRSFAFAGILPSAGELVASLDEPVYLDLQAERDTVLLARGDEATGWSLADAELLGEPVSRGFPLRVRSNSTDQEWSEGAATPRLLCSRVLIHLASVPGAAERFVGWCRRYAEERSVGD
jgi:cobyrinic acid a,c-diamide synthase